MKYKVVVTQMEGRLIIIATRTSSLLKKKTKKKKLSNFEIKLSLSAKHTHTYKQPITSNLVYIVL